MKDRFRSFNSGRANFFLVGFIALVLAGAVCKLTAPVLIPIAIAVLLTFVMLPLARFLQGKHFPSIAVVALIAAIIIAGLYFFWMVLFSSGRTILTLYPKYESRLTEIYIWVAGFFELSYDEQLSFFNNLWAQLGVRNWIRNITFSLSNTFISFLTDTLMVVLFVGFLMAEGDYFSKKIELAFENRHLGQIKKISADVMSQVSRYLTAKFLISLATGLIVAFCLGLTGLEFAVVWGVIQFILNFIPTIGSIVCGTGAIIFALLQFWPDPAPVAIVALIMLGTNMIIGNILEPKIMGDNLGLSPIVVLLSLMIWGWLWGFAGMILAVPMTVIIKIVSENIPVLEPLSILLGSRKAVLAKKAEAAEAETAL